jgi:hypothetical protein
MSSSSSTQLPLYCPIVKYTYTGYRILYYKTYSSIVFPATLRRHLGDMHSGLPAKARQQITSFYKADIDNLISKDTHTALPLPQDDLPPPSPILPIYRRFACGYIKSYRSLTRSYKMIQYHLHQEHRIYRADYQSYIRYIHLQSWYSTTYSVPDGEKPRRRGGGGTETIA